MSLIQDNILILGLCCVGDSLKFTKVFIYFCNTGCPKVHLFSITDFAQGIFTQDFWTPCIKLYFDMSRLIN